MQDINPCRLASCQVATCMSSMDVHISTSSDVLIVCTFMFVPVISCYLFSGITSLLLWLWIRLVLSTYPILVNAQHDAL